jgi:hypothetical protein
MVKFHNFLMDFSHDLSFFQWMLYTTSEIELWLDQLMNAPAHISLEYICCFFFGASVSYFVQTGFNFLPHLKK